MTSNPIITELGVSGQVYDIYGKASVNSNENNATVPYVFNWGGTKAQYEAQGIETSHPEWICFITDDVTIENTYSKDEIEALFIDKSTSETITGTKTFQANSTGTSLQLKSETIDSDVTPTETQYSNYIDSLDKNDKVIGRVFTSKDNTGNNAIAIQAWKDSDCQQIVVKSDGSCVLPESTYGTNFYGTVSSSLLADLAEEYDSDQPYLPGTLIKFGGEKEITIATDVCNGVISKDPGFILNSGKEDALPVALAGKTPVRIVGKVNKFDPITLSEFPGVGRKAKDGERVIAKTLEASDQEGEKSVMCVTKFNLD